MKRILFLILFVSTLYSQDNSYWYYYFQSKTGLPTLTANSNLVRVAPAQYINQATLINNFTVGDTAIGNGTMDVLNTGLNFRINQAGIITKIAFYVTSHNVTEYNFIVMRRNASMNFDSVGASGDLSALINAATLNSLDTFTLPSSITVQWGDFYRVQSKATANYTKRLYAALLDSSRVSGSYIIGSNYNWSGVTNSYNVIPVICFMNVSPIFVTVGDSYAAGYCDSIYANSRYGSQSMWDDASNSVWNNNRVGVHDYISSLTGWTFQNNAMNGSPTVLQVLYDTLKILKQYPRFAVVMGSANDIRSSAGNSTDTISHAHRKYWQDCKTAGIYCFDYGIPPNNTINDTNRTKTNTINKYIRDSASVYGAYSVDLRGYIGTVTGDSIIALWAYDGAHGKHQVHLKTAEALLSQMRKVFTIPNDTCKVRIQSYSKIDSALETDVKRDTIIANGYFLPDSCYATYKINSSTTSHNFPSMTRINDSTFTGTLIWDTSLTVLNDTVKVTSYAVMDNSTDSKTWQFIVRQSHYDVDAQALFLAGTYSDSLKGFINTFFINAKSHLGCTTHLSEFFTANGYFHLFASEDSASAKLNFINPATFKDTTHNMTFTALRGWQGSGFASYGTCGWIPSINGSLNSVTIGIYANLPASGTYDQTNWDLGIISGSNILGVASEYGGSFYSKVNDGTYGTVANTHGPGLYGAVRSASNATQFYWNNTQLGTTANTSTSLPTDRLFFGALHSGGGVVSSASTRRYACDFNSPKMTQTQWNNFYSDILTLLTAIGAN